MRFYFYFHAKIRSIIKISKMTLVYYLLWLYNISILICEVLYEKPKRIR